MVVYHVTTEVINKTFHPRSLNSYHSDLVRDKKIIYFTSSKAYASGFSFHWTDDDVELGSYDNNKTFEIVIPRRMKTIVTRKVRLFMYSFEYDSNIMRKIEGNTTPEFISYTPVPIIGVEEFTSPLECMLSSGLKVSFR